MFKARPAGAVATTGAMLAAFAIGQAIQSSNGAGSPDAFRWLAATVLLLLGALFFGAAVPTPGARTDWVVRAVGALCVLVQLVQLGSNQPAIYLRGANLFDFVMRAVIFAVLASGAMAPKPWLGRLQVFLAIGAFWALGAWILKFSPNPAIDVFSETNEAIRGLFHGENPWSMKYPNIYHHTLWYGPGAADNDWIYVGFPYPPLSLLISALGSFFGDIRWANLASFAVAAVTFSLARGRFGTIAAMLYLSTPRSLFMLEQAWTDVYIVAFLGLVLLSKERFPRATPYLLGLMLVTKQYMIFLAPLIPMLFDEKWSKRDIAIFLGKAAATGLLVTLPFIVMGPVVLFKALTYSQHPFRVEALSFLAATAENGKPTWPVWIQVPLLIPVYGLAWWKGPRGTAGFALGTAAVISVFFAFSKHAFCNHHFLVLGAAACAAAFMLPREAEAKA